MLLRLIRIAWSCYFGSNSPGKSPKGASMTGPEKKSVQLSRTSRFVCQASNSSLSLAQWKRAWVCHWPTKQIKPRPSKMWHLSEGQAGVFQAFHINIIMPINMPFLSQCSPQFQNVIWYKTLYTSLETQHMCDRHVHSQQNTCNHHVLTTGTHQELSVNVFSKFCLVMQQSNHFGCQSLW